MDHTMPGSFLSDHDPICPTVTRASANSSLFLPPQNPSAASSLSHSIRSTPHTALRSNSGSRKRPRLDTTDSAVRTPRTVSLYESRSSIASAFSAAPSPHPFVNTNYRIAGGLDTPTASQNDFCYTSTEEEQDYRQGRFMIRPQPPQSDSYFPQTPALLRREGNGRRRTCSDPKRTGWTKIIWTYTGGVAGKVINFCWNSAFQGFHAGGGHGYQLDNPTPLFGEQSMWTEVGEKEDVFNAKYRGRGGTPVPGEFPQESFIEDYMSHPQSHQQQEVMTPTQLDYGDRGGSTLRGGWTIVNGIDVQSRETSPVRKRLKSSANMLDQRRPVSRTSIANRPKLMPSRSSFSNASFASTRAGASFQDQSQPRPWTADSPAYGHRRSRSSIASPRRESTVLASPEVMQFEKKIKRKEKVQDESIRKLNRQLRDMIREGKQALGTTIEVHDDDEEEEDEDEGYGEGSEVTQYEKW